jgi:hypothetical protein
VTTFVSGITVRRLMTACKDNSLGCIYRLIWNAWQIPAVCTANLQAADILAIYVFFAR